ncbi:MAG TPA: PQQ-binding-like beta-propeller repeat protein [Phycisphaerae bacterium]|nr:PQQ-binding-like beta-propeller repeat protein [Phycisphaerae bacterium]
MLLTVAAVCPAATPRETYWPPKVPGAAKAPPKIEWKEDWQKTRYANVARWQKELAAAGVTGRPQSNRIAAREIYLTAAAIEHFKFEGEERAARHLRIAALFDSLDGDRAFAIRKKVVEEFPGSLAVAATALSGIIYYAYPDRPNWAPRIEWATRRIVALNDIGELPDAHEWIVAALRKRLALRLREMRLIEARADIELLARHVPAGDAQLRAAKADLLYRAGRYEKALAILDKLMADKGAKAYRGDYNRYVSARGQAAEAVLPRRLELEARWEMLRAGPPDAASADEILAGLAQGQSLLARQEELYSSMWQAMGAYLREQPSGALGPLRNLQEEQAAERLSDRRRMAGFQGVFSAFRRCPYSASVQAALLASAERLLRDGRAGLAGRCFQDVLAHTEGGNLAARARVGYWLSLAQQPGGRAALSAAFRGVPPKTPVRWMGRTEPAEAVQRRLVDSLDTPTAKPSAPALSALVQVALQLPAGPAWAPGQLHALGSDVLDGLWSGHGCLTRHGDDLIVFGPNLLARFGPGQTAPRWVRTVHVAGHWTGAMQPTGEEAVVPGPVRPAVEAGAIYCRWGVGRPGGRPKALAAFDRKTGRMLWSTAQDVSWGHLEPICEPAAADGRVYVLAVRADIGVNTPVHLVCLAARSGRVLWQRLLGHQTIPLPAPQYGSLKGRLVNLTHYGAALTIRAGEVYFSTSAGLVGRCDGRDGLVEWARCYRRTAVDLDPAALFRREGAAPILVGDLAIFLPRDCRGAFALDRRSGKPVWDGPLLPSDRAVLLPGGRLLLSDERYLCLADAATGRPRWLQPVPEGVLCPPVWRNGSIYVGVASGMVRISDADGTEVQRTGWRNGRLYHFAIRDGRASGIGVRSGDRVASSTVISPNAPPSPADPRRPLAERWQLARVHPRLLFPPPKAGQGDRAYLASTGVLECLEFSPRPRLKWRSVLAPGFGELGWHNGLLVAVHSTFVEAFDAATGRTRWRCETGLPIRWHQFAGDRLVMRSRDLTLHIAAMDLTRGKMLWEARCGSGLPAGENRMIRRIGWHGKELYVFVQGVWGNQRSHVEVRRLSDGKPVRILRPPSKAHATVACMAFSGDTAVYFGADGRIHEMRLDGSGRRTTHSPVLPNQPDWGAWHLDNIVVAGQWITARYTKGYDYRVRKAYVLRRGDRDYMLAYPGWGEVRGERFWELRDATVTVTDLPSRKPVARYQLPGAFGERTVIVDAKETPSELCTVAFAATDAYDSKRLRIDRFDRKTGKHLAGQKLDLRYWSRVRDDNYHHRRLASVPPRVAWRSDGMVLTTPTGLLAFGPAPPRKKGQNPVVHVVQPAPLPVEVDGSLEEWDALSGIPMAGAPGTDGKILLSHDEKHLYVAVTCRDTDARPRVGVGPYGGGDFLELAIQTLSGDCRVAMGRDDSGHTRVERLSSPELGKGIRAAARHDAGRGRMTYEAAFPLAGIVNQRGPWRRMGLSAMVWDDRSGQGPVPVARFGGAIRDARITQSRHERIRLGPLQRRHESAAIAILRQCPELDESMDFLRGYCRIRYDRSGVRSRFYEDFLRAHARSPLALRLLAGLDQALRERIDDDPSARVLEVAADAGVPEATRRLYQRMTRSYLSLWFHTTTATHGHAALVQLSDGRQGPAGWGHRVFWGYDRWREGTGGMPSRQRASQTLGPANTWLQRRVPLIWLDMHDKPIHGIGFALWAQANVDRVAVGTDGKEVVVLDDDFPPGSKASGKLTWLAGGAKSGSKSLAKRGNVDRDNRQDILLAKPVTVHLAGPAAAAVDKPRAIAALRKHLPEMEHSELGWRFFGALQRLEAGQDANEQAALNRWYLSIAPKTRRAYDILGGLRNYYEKRQKEGWVKTLNEIIRDSKLPRKTAYRFRVDRVPDLGAYFRSWRVIGPFPVAEEKGKEKGKEKKKKEKDPGEKPHPIESEPVDLSKAYAAGDKTVRWQLLESEKPGVDLDKHYGRPDHVFAYAVCWVQCPKAGEAVIEMGADDSAKLWLNREALPDCKVAGARRHHVPVTLRAGWNEVLLRVTDKVSTWQFYFELLRPDGNGLPEGARLSTTPPTSATTRP